MDSILYKVKLDRIYWMDWIFSRFPEETLKTPRASRRIAKQQKSTGHNVIAFFPRSVKWIYVPMTEHYFREAD